MRTIIFTAALLALLVVPGAPARAEHQGAETSEVRAAPQAEATAEDSAYDRRLRRARAEHEARRAEAAARREAEQGRQRELSTFQGSVSGLSRRESYLQHELYWAQREFDSISRDPADVSAMARRSSVERELRDIRSQYDTTGGLRQGAMRQLDSLRVR
ncbi:MAG: hypothetical protein ACT4PS_11035 [Betaproteobacteria bacterium]